MRIHGTFRELQALGIDQGVARTEAEDISRFRYGNLICYVKEYDFLLHSEKYFMQSNSGSRPS